MIIYLCIKFQSNTSIFSYDNDWKLSVLRIRRTYMRTAVILYAPPHPPTPLPPLKMWGGVHKNTFFFFKTKNCSNDDPFNSCNYRIWKMLHNICMSAVAISLRRASRGPWASSSSFSIKKKQVSDIICYWFWIYPKYWDRQAWTNSDPDQVQQNMTSD